MINVANGVAVDLDEYREELKDALPVYLRAGAIVTAAEGKNPGWAMGDGWQRQRLDAEALERLVDRVEHPAIGVRLGPGGGAIDFDIDGPGELRAFMELFDNDPPVMPQYASGRDGGEHRLAACDRRLLATKAATITYKTADGRDKITVRIGCRPDDETGELTGAHSVVPPSLHAKFDEQTKTWNWTGRRYCWLPGCDLETVGLRNVADVVIERLLVAHKPKRPSNGAALNGHAPHGGALSAMLRLKPKSNETDGSKRLFSVACRAVERDLGDEQAIATIRAYAAKRPFPNAWTDTEILQRLRDAEQKVTRGDAVVISNFETIEEESEEGEKSRKTIPRSMGEIIADIHALTGGWPRRVDGTLFIDDDNGLSWFDRRAASGLFGWLRRLCKVEWAKGGNYVAQSELFAELERTARQYQAIEVIPHEPIIANIYYRGEAPPVGNGEHLSRLLNRFRPQTPIDRDLIQGAFMTALWGGPPGRRPAHVITSDDGRGSGKSTVAEVIGHLCGGVIDVSAGEDIEVLKARLLSPKSRTTRIALIDNVKSMKLSWAELESLITSPVISGRQLYVGEAQRPNLLTWILTLNGVSLATDMAQRSVIVKVVKGINSGPWYEETIRFIDDHRQQIIGDILGALRSEPHPLEKFTRWSTWEQAVLARLPEPAEAQRVISERQHESNCEADEAEILEQYFAQQLRRLDYDPTTSHVRIPVATAALWFSKAIGDPVRVATASKRLHQMKSEGQLDRIAPDPSRRFGRCFLWTGEHVDCSAMPSNDLGQRIAQTIQDRHLGDRGDGGDGGDG